MPPVTIAPLVVQLRDELLAATLAARDDGRGAVLEVTSTSVEAQVLIAHATTADGALDITVLSAGAEPSDAWRFAHKLSVQFRVHMPPSVGQDRSSSGALVLGGWPWAPMPASAPTPETSTSSPLRIHQSPADAL
jgi:hypothetical protein